MFIFLLAARGKLNKERAIGDPETFRSLGRKCFVQFHLTLFIVFGLEMKHSAAGGKKAFFNAAVGIKSARLSLRVLRK